MPRQFTWFDYFHGRCDLLNLREADLKTIESFLKFPATLAEVQATRTFDFTELAAAIQHERLRRRLKNPDPYPYKEFGDYD